MPGIFDTGIFDTGIFDTPEIVVVDPTGCPTHTVTVSFTGSMTPTAQLGAKMTKTLTDGTTSMTKSRICE